MPKIFKLAGDKPGHAIKFYLGLLRKPYLQESIGKRALKGRFL